MGFFDFLKKKNNDNTKLVMHENSIKHVIYKHSLNQCMKKNHEQEKISTCYSEVSYLTNLEQILKNRNITTNSLHSFLIGQDNKLYILLSNNVSSVRKKYAVVILDIDWNKSEILNEDYYELGEYEQIFYSAQPIGNNILLINSGYANGQDNAIIVDRLGNVIKKLYLGDCIQNCIVNNSENIIVSYYDEGIFSGDEISMNGLNVFDINGEIIWKSDKPIDDCYAINIDENENIWYYYYSDFKLIKTDMKQEKIYEPHIEGASAFLISSDAKNIVFEAGYNNKNNFIIGKFQNEEIVELENLNLTFNNENVNINCFSFRKSLAVFLDDNNRIFIKKF